ncbi:unnamed protein product [Prorocentrum cordatum]|uniref:Cellulase n=1 Tax=Prorocentrum cordatum TaxID=2364126 RepID=A0ABN9PAR1_9DINO|nr:unnamed protein product [Polarella glacialis]
MESYEGCSATADWDQSWCYVQGGSNCNQYLNSTVAGETRKWRECGSCNCMTEWNYDGDGDGVMEAYEGCSATADWDQSWCYVQGGSNCNQALNSTVAGETRKWRECGSCNCMTEWNYDGDADGVMEAYEGCSATADWDQSWCYVQGGSNCNQALNSTVAGETRKWRECGSCNCMTECGTTMAMPTGLWSRTRAAAPQRTGTRAGATYRAVPIVTRPWTPPWPARRASGASAAPATA